ncbi:MAG TPA: hypothetical protein VGO24_09015 [Solirubrobacterales bacterium]|nr:hypothetical protein [Solirubrobacterales bacterium]
MPATATGLADVAAGDYDPLEVRRRREHRPQQLTVRGLGSVATLEGLTRVRHPPRQPVPHRLQPTEIKQSRLAMGHARRLRWLELDPAEGVAVEAGELTLEAGDLRPQLGAGEALVDWRPERGKTVPVEQIRHQTSV